MARPAVPTPCSAPPRASTTAPRGARTAVGQRTEADKAHAVLPRSPLRVCLGEMPGDDFEELLLAAGRATWAARAARKGRVPLPRHEWERLRVPQAVQRTGDSLWLDRAGRSRRTASSRLMPRQQGTGADVIRSGPATSAWRLSVGLRASDGALSDAQCLLERS